MTSTKAGLVLAAGVLALLPAAGLGAADDERAQRVIAEARQAIGGDKVAGVKALAIEGRYRRVFGEREMSGDLEIAFELPDKYLHVETLGGGDVGNTPRRYVGFNGDQALNRFSGGGGMMIRMQGPDGRQVDPAEMQARMLRMARADFARLLAGWMVASSPAVPVTFSYVGEAEAEDGRADVLEARGETLPPFRLFIDKATHLPLMMTFQQPEPRMRFMNRRPGEPRPSREEMEARMREAPQGPPPMVEVQVYFSDHREVDGVKLPGRVSRAVNGQTNEEWEITKVQINPSFDAGRFVKP